MYKDDSYGTVNSEFLGASLTAVAALVSGSRCLFCPSLPTIKSAQPLELLADGPQGNPYPYADPYLYQYPPPGGQPAAGGLPTAHGGYHSGYRGMGGPPENPCQQYLQGNPYPYADPYLYQYPPPGGQPAAGGPSNVQGGYHTGFGAQGGPAAVMATSVWGQTIDDQEEKQRMTAVAFAEQKVRKGFVAKVFSIILIQLLVTTAITLIFMFVPEVTSYVEQNSWVLWTSYVLMIVFMLVIVCGGEIRRKWPANMILLSIFTVVMSVFVACNTVFFTAPEVGMALGITCGMVLGIVIFALMPCVDFTMCGGVIVALSFTLIFAIIIAFFVNLFCDSCYRITGLVIASIAVFVFSIYLLYDIQLVMGGKRMALDVDEYILAVLNIYMDIIMIFLFILKITGLSSR